MNSAYGKGRRLAGLVRPIRTEIQRTPVTIRTSAPILLRPSTTAAKLASFPALPMKPPRRQNWFMRNPALAWVIIGGGIFFGSYLAACGFNTDCD